MPVPKGVPEGEGSGVGGFGGCSEVPSLRGESLVVEGSLLPGHGLYGAGDRGGLEAGCSVGVEAVSQWVDGGEWTLSQAEGVLVL